MGDRDGVPTSLGEGLRGRVAESPDAPAVTDDDETVSRSEFEDRTNRLARAFAARGVGEGSMVAIAVPNGVRHLECSVAAWKLGAVPLPVSHKLPAGELEAIVALADAALVVGEDPGDGRPWLRADHDASAESPDPLPPVIGPSWKAPTSGGSTGRPKIIVAGQAPTMEAVLARTPTLRIDRDGVFLVTAPLYHNAPFMFSLMALLQGHHIVIMKRFDAAETLDLVGRHGVTWLYVVPTMMGRLLRLPDDVRAAADLSSVRTVLHVGAPCPEHVKRGFLVWFGPERVIELYAGSESQATAMIDGVDWLAHPGSVGQVTRGFMKVCGEDGVELPPGEVGEIWMRTDGDAATYRYIGAEARSRDGWESLGDMGRFDADGYLYLADRRSDMILVGGANVYPAEIEAALSEHPAVLGSAVIGLPDEDLGNVVHAIVQLLVPLVDVEDDLRAHLATRLARTKLPRTFEQTGEQLRDDTGKIRRSALRTARVAPTGGVAPR
ncbi:MAG: AMP-binding protein [Pseudonocardia sp.]|nr:AMP-binding protein [Pseudonocardia sp.]